MNSNVIQKSMNPKNQVKSPMQIKSSPASFFCY